MKVLLLSLLLVGCFPTEIYVTYKVEPSCKRPILVESRELGSYYCKYVSKELGLDCLPTRWSYKVSEENSEDARVKSQILWGHATIMISTIDLDCKSSPQ